MPTLAGSPPKPTASVDRGTWHLMTGLPYLVRLAGFGLRRLKAANPGRSLAVVITP